jgi:Calponin homology (CH) domain
MRVLRVEKEKKLLRKMAVNRANDEDRDEGRFGYDAELFRQRSDKFEDQGKFLRARRFLMAQCKAASDLGESHAELLERAHDSLRQSSTLQALHELLKDGTLLCILSSHWLQGSAPLACTLHCTNVLQERENVATFIESLDALKIRPEERCTVADLHSGRDLFALVDCILAMQRVIESGVGAFDKHAKSLNEPLREHVDAGPAVNQARSPMKRRGLFGMNAELAERIEAKFDPQRARAALAWVRAVAGSDENDSDGAANDDELSLDFLKDGVLLCELVNTIRPGIVKKIHRSKIVMLHRENVQMYLAACRLLGVLDTLLFSPSDLVDDKFPSVVIDNLYALSRAATLIPTFGGPFVVARQGEVALVSASGHDMCVTNKSGETTAAIGMVEASSSSCPCIIL